VLANNLRLHPLVSVVTLVLLSAALTGYMLLHQEKKNALQCGVVLAMLGALKLIAESNLP